MGKKCRICGNIKGNICHNVEERMFNMGENFEYLECSRCGTLQLNTREIDFNKYYPPNYGGFYIENGSTGKIEQVIYSFFARMLIHFNYSVSDRLNCLLNNKFDYIQCLFGLKVNKKSRILDIGCGSGEWLIKLSKLGYQDLTGVDLYNHNKIKKFNFIEGDVFSVSDNQRFDIITLHHSFEHMDFPEKILSRCRTLLKDNGVLIIRVPVMGKYAWKKYGIFWAQIDAPRHLFLYTEKSLNYLLIKCGLKLSCIHYDSNSFFQIKASEIYKNTKISLQNAIRRGDMDKKNVHQEKIVKRLNRTCNGDQAIFVIKKC